MKYMQFKREVFGPLFPFVDLSESLKDAFE